MLVTDPCIIILGLIPFISLKYDMFTSLNKNDICTCVTFNKCMIDAHKYMYIPKCQRPQHALLSSGFSCSWSPTVLTSKSSFARINLKRNSYSNNILLWWNIAYLKENIFKKSFDYSLKANIMYFWSFYHNYHSTSKTIISFSQIIQVKFKWQFFYLVNSVIASVMLEPSLALVSMNKALTSYNIRFYEWKSR